MYEVVVKTYVVFRYRALALHLDTHELQLRHLDVRPVYRTHTAAAAAGASGAGAGAHAGAGAGGVVRIFDGVRKTDEADARPTEPLCAAPQPFECKSFAAHSTASTS